MRKFYKFCTSILITIFIPISVLPAFAVNPIFPFFYDVADIHKNFFAISELKNRGIINGYADGTFKPDQEVNRAEALKILLLGSQVSLEKNITQNPFVDVPLDAWFTSYISYAKNKAIIQGRDDGTYFVPEDTINKAEALKMLLLVNDVTPPPVEENFYADVPVDAWFAPYFEDARWRGLFDTGKGENVNPGEKLTRGELSEMMYRFIRHNERKTTDRIGIGSWYQGKLEDGIAGYTTAHRTIEIGKKIKVTDLQTGKQVIVRVNDRGPYIPGRILDLSAPAFEYVSSLGKGVSLFEFEETSDDIIEGPYTPPTPNIPTPLSIPKNSWSPIILENDITPVARKGETIVINGTIDTNIENISALFTDPKTNELKIFTAPITNNQFSIPIFFENTGETKLGILLEGEKITNYKNFTIHDPVEIPAKANTTPLSGPTDLSIDIKEGKTYIQWSDNENNFFHLTFRQSHRIKNLYVNGINKIELPRSVFSEFNKGEVLITLAGAQRTNSSSNELNRGFGERAILSKIIIPSFESIKNESVTELSSPSFIQKGIPATISGKSRNTLRNEITIIDPDGTIYKEPLKTSEDFSFSYTFTPKKIGTYVLEIVKSDGIAEIILPLYPKGFLPLLPNSLEIPISDNTTLNPVEQGISLVNTFREQNGIPPLVEREELSALAQFRAEDMINRQYFSHITPGGKDVNDFLAEFSIKTTVAENLALSSSITKASKELESSANHRKILLNPQYENIGIGVSQKTDGSFILVQLFSEAPTQESDLPNLKASLLPLINERRDTPLIFNDELNTFSQEWSEVMKQQEKVGFSFESGDNLKDNISNFSQSTPIQLGLSMFSSKYQMLNFFKENTQTLNPFLENSIQKIGIGIELDSDGIFYLTLIGAQ